MGLKRSVINQSIDAARAVFAELGLYLPEWAAYPPPFWEHSGSAYEEVRVCMLGWDVTDFGSGDFPRIGRTLFTLRNGRTGDPQFPKGYAEKLILDPENQRAPAHYHRQKREDIINRGGGNLLMRLTPPAAQAGPFTVSLDGVRMPLPPDGILRLTPGQSLSLAPGVVHQFWGEEGTGLHHGNRKYTVSGEVSSVCDDWNDNVFLEEMQRFPPIEEDEPRRYYLCHEYPRSAMLA